MHDATTTEASAPAPVTTSGVAAESAGYASRAATVATASRLIMAALATATVLTLGVARRALFMRDPLHAESMHGFWANVFQPWAHWDGVWFVRIAADGYAAHPQSPAFFPLYPLTMRAVSLLTNGNLVVAGVLVSLVCYAAAMVLLFRFAQDELGRQAALWTVVFISLFPTALVFQAVYSESLFLLLTLLCLSLARRGRWAPACAAGLLAALTRSTGVLLLLPLAMLWWEQRRGERIRLPGGPATAVMGPVLDGGRGLRAPAKRLGLSSPLWLLLVPAGLALYMAYLWRVFGNPLLFATVEGDWGRHLGQPLSTLWRELLAVGAGLRALAVHGLAPVFMHTPDGGFHFVALANCFEALVLAAAVLMLVACWRHLPAPYTVYAAACLLFPLLTPATVRPLSSVPRFTLVVFPLFMGAAAALSSHRVWRWALLAIMVPLLLLGTVLFANFT